MTRDKGYVCGLSSIICCAGFYVLPFAFSGGFFSQEVNIILSVVRVLWIFLPVAAFALAFIGKVRSAHGTTARKLCNIGAGIGLFECASLVLSGLALLWIDILSIPASAAEMTIFVDAVLIVGYFIVAYICGKIFWFI